MSQYKIDSSGEKRKLYTRICACGCGQAYQTTSTSSRYCKAHTPTHPKGGKKKLSNQPYHGIIPTLTVQEAYAQVPSDCPKCAGQVIQVSVIDEVMYARGDGFGISWHCVTCGKMGYPVAGLPYRSMKKSFR